MKKQIIIVFLIIISILSNVGYTESSLDIVDEVSLNIQEHSHILNSHSFELIDENRLTILSLKSMPITDMLKVHTVKEGENLWNIANKHDIDIDTLIGANDFNNINTIRPGDKINILPMKGILYKISPGENLSIISQKYNLKIEIIKVLNDIKDPDKIFPARVLFLPGVKPEFGFQDRIEKKFIRPVVGRISSPFGKRWGKMHEGIDFAVPSGTRVEAGASGIVTYSGWARGYGQTVIIEHQKGFHTLYAHISKLLVKKGQRVSQGELIALSGNTGTTTGPNLHFEVHVNSRPVDPIKYLR